MTTNEPTQIEQFYTESRTLSLDAFRAGQLFATGSDTMQRLFLLGMAKACEEFSWPVQCQCLHDRMTAEERDFVARRLSTLLDYMTETLTPSGEACPDCYGFGWIPDVYKGRIDCLTCKGTGTASRTEVG